MGQGRKKEQVEHLRILLGRGLDGKPSVTSELVRGVGREGAGTEFTSPSSVRECGGRPWEPAQHPPHQQHREQQRHNKGRLGRQSGPTGATEHCWWGVEGALWEGGHTREGGGAGTLQGPPVLRPWLLRSRKLGRECWPLWKLRTGRGSERITCLDKNDSLCSLGPVPRLRSV